MYQIDRKTVYIIMAILLAFTIYNLATFNLLATLLTLPGVIIALSFHEFAHAFVAAAGADHHRALRAVHLQVVERILVAFEPQVLEAVRDAPRGRGRLAVLPVGRIDHLLDARLQDGVEMVAHLD